MQKYRTISVQAIILFAVFLILPKNGISVGVGDYLIMQDIDAYKMMGSGGGGTGSGIVTAANHFNLDHADVSYETIYFSDAAEIGVQVQVTQHAGSGSDKWLLHEVESSLRGRSRAGQLGASLYESASVREINGNKIFDYGNVDYRWISNYVVVYIHYTDLDGTKPEPLEVVTAYLAKFPSTITLTDTEIKSQAHSITWIKDEMDRRLWLCDKWFMQLQLKKAEEREVYEQAVKSMNIFLDYREKYFGSFFTNLKAAPEKNLLAQFLAQNNGTGIRTKLKEYKDWWAGNKDKSISL